MKLASTSNLLRGAPHEVEGALYDLVQLHRNEGARLAKFRHEAEDQHERHIAIGNIVHNDLDCSYLRIILAAWLAAVELQWRTATPHNAETRLAK